MDAPVVASAPVSGRSVAAPSPRTPTVPEVAAPREAPDEPAYLAGPSLFWRLLAANLFVVLGGAVIGTWLTRRFVMSGSFTPATHAVMVFVAVVLSAALSALILRDALRPVEAQRRELREKTAELQRLATMVLAAQEDERRRIARELHDETMQSVAALIMGLEQGLQQMPEDVPHLRAAHRSTARLRDLAVRTLEEIRHLALALRPAVLDDHGLVAAVRWLAQEHQERSGLDVQVELGGRFAAGAEADAEAERLPTAVETALFRIAQEAMANVAKHAHAQHVRIRVESGAEAAAVEIEDDGIGFDVDVPPPPGHMGLFNMRERALLLGGRCTVARGSSGRGTLVRAEVPVPLSGRAQRHPSPGRVPAPLPITHHSSLVTR